MAIYVREIEGLGIGAFRAKDDDDAWRKTENAYGSNNVLDVREAEESELNYIRGMGGFVPSEELS